MGMVRTLGAHPCIAALVLAVAAGPAVAQENKDKDAPPPLVPVRALAAPVAPVILNQLYSQAEAAFAAQKYPEAAAKLAELLKLAGDKPGLPLEMLHFNLGLAYLLGGKTGEAEWAFEECARKFPKGEYTSRCHLGIGKAIIAQGENLRRPAAVEAFKQAGTDPKLQVETAVALGQVYLDRGQRDEALEVLRPLIGAEVGTAQQTSAAVDAIGLLAECKGPEELAAFLDYLGGQPGVRDAIAWYVNQIIVKADALAIQDEADSALAIYRAVPPRTQILEIQAAALVHQQAELASLKARRAAEEDAGGLEGRTNIVELISQAEAAIKLMIQAKTAMEGRPDFDAALLMRRGRCYYYAELPRDEEARMCFSTIREKYPDATDAQAAAYAEIVMCKIPRDSAMLQTLASAFTAKYPDAPNLANVLLLVGQAFTEAGDWAKAQGVYEDLATRFPQAQNMEGIRFNIAEAVLRQGDTTKAKALFEQFLKDYPNSSMKEGVEGRLEKVKAESK